MKNSVWYQSKQEIVNTIIPEEGNDCIMPCVPIEMEPLKWNQNETIY